MTHVITDLNKYVRLLLLLLLLEDTPQTQKRQNNCVAEVTRTGVAMTNTILQSNSTHEVQLDDSTRLSFHN